MASPSQVSPEDDQQNESNKKTQPQPPTDSGSSQKGSRMNQFLGVSEVKNRRFWRMIIAEILGTLLLVFIGCGSCVEWRKMVLDDPSTPVNPGTDVSETHGKVVHIAFTFGIAVATIGYVTNYRINYYFMIDKLKLDYDLSNSQKCLFCVESLFTISIIAQALGHVSGAHLNPAVSLGLVCAGQCGILKALIYIVAQCVGALLGAVLLWVVIPNEKHYEANAYGIGVTTVHPDVANLTALLIELIITFTLVLTVCAVCDGSRTDIKGSAPLAIGLSITVCHFMAINATGSSMNPARSFGPALIWAGKNEKGVKDLWVYMVGPTLGGVLAGIIYQFVFQQPPPPVEEPTKAEA